MQEYIQQVVVHAHLLLLSQLDQPRPFQNSHFQMEYLDYQLLLQAPVEALDRNPKFGMKRN